MKHLDIIKKPLITEKASLQRESQNQYAFMVDGRANKHQIKQAVEKFFNVKVADVRTLIVRGKYTRVGQSIGKRSNWKKAIVTLPQDQKIELFTNV